MVKQILLSFICPLAIAGCAASPPFNPTASIDHPANSNAPEAPLQPPSQALASTPVEAAPSSTQPMGGMPHMGHDMGGMKGMNHDMRHTGEHE